MLHIKVLLSPSNSHVIMSAFSYCPTNVLHQNKRESTFYNAKTTKELQVYKIRKNKTEVILLEYTSFVSITLNKKQGYFVDYILPFLQFILRLLWKKLLLICCKGTWQSYKWTAINCISTGIRVKQKIKEF